MKKRIKDLTEEELKQICHKNELRIENCKNCILYQQDICTRRALVAIAGTNFLDREVDIPQKHILDKQEHDYLRAVCKPFKIMSIEKKDYKAYQQIEFFYNKSGKSYSTFSLPPFKKGSMYKGMKPFKQYSIAYLELDKEWNND